MKDLMTRGKGKTATVIGLYGDLGSGKTIFTQFCAKYLKIEESVASPTFLIEKIYKTENSVFKIFIHVDAYRLDSGEDLRKLGFEETLQNPESLIFIEWPERVSEILPEHIRVRCEFITENKREYEIIF